MRVKEYIERLSISRRAGRRNHEGHHPHHDQGDTMKFMMQIFQGEALEAWASLSEEEQQGIAAGYAAINETPGVTPGEWLSQPVEATTVRVRDGATVTTDGPFAETKEALGGYFMFEGESLEAAIELAARVPAVRFGGAVEVRPLVQYG
jgi:hypothetical protein